MAIVLNAGERLLGSKVNLLTGGKTHFIGEIGMRGATKKIETNILGETIKETPIAARSENILAYYKK